MCMSWKEGVETGWERAIREQEREERPHRRRAARNARLASRDWSEMTGPWDDIYEPEEHEEE
jgi:hypothetical protein